MKENSPTSKVTCVGKRKLQTQQTIGDLPMGKLNEKITTYKSKKLKIDEETDVLFYPNIREEPNEPEYYTTSPIQSPAKQKKQSTGKKLQRVRNKVRRRNLYLNSLEEIPPGLQTNSG